MSLSISDKKNITSLNCSHNRLVSDLRLPTNLEILDCSHNDMKVLPVLPNTLTDLDCCYNYLRNLTPLPATLKSLYCNDNKLMSLPPTLKQTECIKNMPHSSYKCDEYNEARKSNPDIQGNDIDNFINENYGGDIKEYLKTT